ncbi:hypothetical protein [Shewanella algae]|uniref:hypothetical protein n=1 Tax=Shewanella algae TaxID=38313 RepID=UPI001AACDC3E|nr:hypothetical protein [Shewanella algae]MBO2558270.1 hypothetical protein [Shewanella algae]MBO2575206.1 hypothetical protein [Shewanella algae]
MQPEAIISRPLKQLAKEGKLNEHLIRSMYRHFVAPINENGFDIDELRGKYKPSWEYSGPTSATHKAWLEAAETHSLHHYHVGFVTYKSGNDPHYLGDESDGLIHTKIDHFGSVQRHIIFKADECHPKPFSFPFDPAIDFAV